MLPELLNRNLYQVDVEKHINNLYPLSIIIVGKNIMKIQEIVDQCLPSCGRATHRRLSRVLCTAGMACVVASIPISASLFSICPRNGWATTNGSTNDDLPGLSDSVKTRIANGVLDLSDMTNPIAENDEKKKL